MTQPVKVEGLAELRKKLRKIEDPTHLKEFQAGLKKAGEVVVPAARAKARPFSNRAAETIRVTSGGNRVYVSAGKASLRWYGWADFGSRRPRSGQPRSVGPWAKSGKGPKGGRFIYPGLKEKTQEVERAVDAAMEKSIKGVGL